MAECGGEKQVRRCDRDPDAPSPRDVFGDPDALSPYRGVFSDPVATSV